MPCIRLWLRGAAVAAFLVPSLLVVAPGVQVANAANAAPQLHVSGNHLVNASGQTVVLHGVNRSGGEFACVQGWGIWDGPMDQTSIDAMKTWGINSVRVPLNEACWNAESYVNSAYRGATYEQAVVNYVNLLNQNGLVAILDLHWSDGAYTGISSNCASAEATCQKPLPDAAQAVPFWTSVASTFKGNNAVIFDLFNEPYPQWATGSEASGWQCWLSGGTCTGIPYSVAGMQQLVDAVRSTGAANVIALGGLNYSNDLTAWLAHKPTDSSNNLVASWHSYDSQTCNSSSCWTSQIAPAVAQVPLIVGELGESDCGHSYIDPLMTWLDSQGASYLAWTWNSWDCSSGPSLISDYAGTATAYGAGYKAHLLSLAATHFTVAVAANPWPAGQAHTVTVKALDAYGNTATGYRGTVHFTTSDTKASVPANHTFTAGDAGVHTFPNTLSPALTLKTAGTQWVRVTDTTTASITGVQTVTVTPGAAKTFKVVANTTWAAGASHTVIVTALDAYGNTATGYTGTIHFTTSDTKATVPADYTFTAAGKGVHAFANTLSPALTLKTAGSQWVRATDKTTASITGTQTGIVVSPGAAKTLKVVANTTWAAGASHTVIVTALDAYGNTATGYRGTIHFTTSDTKASVPANYTFTAADKGVHTFPNALSPALVLKTAGTQTVRARDTVTSTITGTQTVLVN